MLYFYADKGTDKSQMNWPVVHMVKHAGVQHGAASNLTAVFSPAHVQVLQCCRPAPMASHSKGASLVSQTKFPEENRVLTPSLTMPENRHVRG